MVAPGWISTPVRKRLTWRDDPREHGDVGGIEGVSEAVELARLEAGVGEHDLGRVAGGGVSIQDSLDIAANGLQDGHVNPRPPREHV